MSRRVIPAGDSLKDFHRAGGEAWTESERPTVPTLEAPGRLMTSCFARESSLPRASLFSGGPPLHRLLITISRIPEFLNSENFEDSVNSILLHHCSMIEPS